MTKRHQLIALSAAIAALGATGLAAYRQPPALAAEPAQAEPAPTVIVTRPVRRNLTEWDYYSGRFVAVDQVAVRSRVSGYLAAIHFKDGAIVNRGQPLFTIDPRPFDAARRAAQAAVAEAEAGLALARAGFARSSALANTRAVSAQRVDQDRAQVRQAEAQVLAAEAALTQATLNLEFTVITAPITGRVNAHNVDIGNLVRGDDADAPPLTSIVSLDPMHIVFDVSQNAYLNYARAARRGERPSSRQTANPVNVAIDGDSGYPRRARMEFVANRVDPTTGTVRARAVIDNPDHLFAPGLFVRLQLMSRPDAETLLIPDAAVATEQTARVVFVVNADERVETRRVELGPLIDGERVIRQGLSADDRVIVEGLHRVRAGSPVVARTAEPQTTSASASDAARSNQRG